MLIITTTAEVYVLVLNTNKYETQDVAPPLPFIQCEPFQPRTEQNILDLLIINLIWLILQIGTWILNFLVKQFIGHDVCLLPYCNPSIPTDIGTTEQETRVFFSGSLATIKLWRSLRSLAISYFSPNKNTIFLWSLLCSFSNSFPFFKFAYCVKMYRVHLCSHVVWRYAGVDL